MHIIETIYIMGVVLAIIACAPQLRQLMITKASDEFSLSTWSVWLLTQCATLIYVVSLGNTLMIIANIVWISYYALMVGLIIRYRSPITIAAVDTVESEA